MKDLVLIAVGGAGGSIFRFLLSRLTYRIFGGFFPFGTLFVNGLGSFFIGFLSVFLLERVEGYAEELRALLMVGLLGGFTTFSTFSLETFYLWENHEPMKTLLNIIITISLCLVATWSGVYFGRKI